MCTNRWTRSAFLAVLGLLPAAAYAGVPLESVSGRRAALVVKLIDGLKVIRADVARSEKRICEIDAAVEEARRHDEEDAQKRLQMLADAVHAELKALEIAAERATRIRHSLDSLAAGTDGEVRPGTGLKAPSRRYPVFEVLLQQAYQLLARLEDRIVRVEARAFRVLKKIHDAQSVKEARARDTIGKDQC